MPRFLFVVPPLAGHVNPTVSVAKELLARGHEVAWVGHRGAIEPWLPGGANLFPVEDCGSPLLAAQRAAMARTVRGLESLRFLFDDFLLPLARMMLADVERAVEVFRPSVLVVDQQALAGRLVARRRGLAWASFATTSTLLTDPVPELPKVGEWLCQRLASLDLEAALTPTEDFGLSPHLVIVFSTEALMGAKVLPAHFHFVGPSLSDRPDPTPFPWDWFRAVPRILVTLGTVNVDRGSHYFKTALEAFQDQPLQVVLVAPPELVGPAPENVLVRVHIPQLAVLPHVNAIVCHGGHNTVCEALANGLPLVLAPIKDDQMQIARQVVGAGAGIKLRFGRFTAADLRQSAERALGDPKFRDAAKRIQASFAAAGGARRAAELLKGLA